MRSGKRIRIGDHWVTDDRTGIPRYASEMVVQWDGLAVRKGTEEGRHPQEFVRPRVDPYPPINIRPEQGTDFDLVCGKFVMEYVPNTTQKRTLSQVDLLLPFAGVDQMSIGPTADKCGLWFVVT